MWAWHWTWYSWKRCRYELDIGLVRRKGQLFACEMNNVFIHRYYHSNCGIYYLVQQWVKASVSNNGDDVVQYDRINRTLSFTEGNMWREQGITSRRFANSEIDLILKRNEMCLEVKVQYLYWLWSCRKELLCGTTDTAGGSAVSLSVLTSNWPQRR